MQTGTRIETAVRLLRAAVFAARSGGRGEALAAEQSGGCGLGSGPRLDVPLDADGERWLRELWPAGLSEAETVRVRDVLVAWVRRQDGLDRQRNHFMKAFRGRHGFDRRAYAPEVEAEYEAGLADVNAEENRRLSEAAAALLG